MKKARWAGRFAPSPTGGLHFGSLVAATGSFLDARCNDGQWLVRIEDIDPPREVPGAADSILSTLDHLGFEWDGSVVYQSQQSSIYEDALAKLKAKGLIYRCTCSRRDIAATSKHSALGSVYPGLCRNRNIPDTTPAALRVQVPDVEIAFHDRLQGEQRQNLSTLTGDFMVGRVNGLWAYYLASVVDDITAGITHIVRGKDLLMCTFPQLWLYQSLNSAAPKYAHLPVATYADGCKLSKQTFAQPIDVLPPGQCLWFALSFLQQNPPPSLQQENVAAIWQWALTHWQTERCRGIDSLPVPAWLS